MGNKKSVGPVRARVRCGVYTLACVETCDGSETPSSSRAVLYRLQGIELVRRDPYAREADFDSAWCAVPPQKGHFPWRNLVRPQDAIVAWGKLNLYELHVGSFTAEGSFTAATARLEHVKALGFTGIQLMPCTEFGGAWGYNPRQLMTVHSPWGTADDLRRYASRSPPLLVNPAAPPHTQIPKMDSHLGVEGGVCVLVDVHLR